MFIVKLGGSVITDKSKRYCFHVKTMTRLAYEIKKADIPLALVHGAGSYGHILAKEYQLNDGYNNKDQLKGFALTQAKVQELNSLVLSTLQEKKISAISLPPHAFLRLDDHRIDEINYSIIDNYLKKGFTPVTFGDVALDKTLSFSICSGDLLMRVLAKHYKPKKAVFVVDVDGIYSANPKKNPDAVLLKSASVGDLENLTTAVDGHADVTEGMKGKINTIKMIAQLGIDTIVVNGNKKNRLYKVLVGEETICTYIHGMKK
ncbi:MAG: isopentenyl phosphate kinase [Euryarchaeota archaeon]|nr:isopentenyl phosphate kinase [Euryarchaeota archaeon]